MIVREYIEFERGKDPKSAMKIGMLRSLDEMTDLFDDIQELVCTSSYLHFQKEFRDDVMSLIPDDMQGNHGWGNIHLSFKQLPRDILYDFNRLIEKYSQLMGLNESLEFERGKDPKDAMKVGKARDKEIISKSYKEMAGGDIERYGDYWDLHSKTNIGGHTAYVIELSVEEQKVYLSLIPGVTINTQFYARPETSLEFLKERLDRLDELN